MGANISPCSCCHGCKVNHSHEVTKSLSRHQRGLGFRGAELPQLPLTWLGAEGSQGKCSWLACTAFWRWKALAQKYIDTTLPGPKCEAVSAACSPSGLLLGQCWGTTTNLAGVWIVTEADKLSGPVPGPVKSMGDLIDSICHWIRLLQNREFTKINQPAFSYLNFETHPHASWRPWWLLRSSRIASCLPVPHVFLGLRTWLSLVPVLSVEGNELLPILSSKSLHRGVWDMGATRCLRHGSNQ